MATSQEFQKYYADLLILQYKTQPKARATIKALVKEIYGSGSLLDIVNGYGNGQFGPNDSITRTTSCF